MMEEQRAGNESAESELGDPELRRPDEAVKDLEPEEQAAEDVRGGYMKLEETRYLK